jgi:uncharacterized protein
MASNGPIEPALPRRGYLGFTVEARPEPDHPGERERWIVAELAPHVRELALGDDVLELDGHPLASLAEVRARAAAVPPGSHCSVLVRRGAHTVLTELLAQPMPLETLEHGEVKLGEVPWPWAGQVQRLRAIWTYPVHTAPTHAVWLLPSAAWISQESPLDPNDPTLKLVDAMTSAGLVTLRVERSSLGDSEGPAVNDLDFAAELSMGRAVRRYFLEHTPGLKRGIFGRSMGGMLAPLLGYGPELDKIAVWGTSSLNWHEASLESFEHQRRLRGQSGAALEKAKALHERLQRLVYIEGLSPRQARTDHPELANVALTEFGDERVYDRVWTFFSQLQTHDVARAWAQISAQVLAIHAEYDIIVPQIALRRLAAIPRSKSQFSSFARVDHFFHERSSIAEAVEKPWGGVFSAAAAQLVTDFFLREV